MAWRQVSPVTSTDPLSCTLAPRCPCHLFMGVEMVTVHITPTDEVVKLFLKERSYVRNLDAIKPPIWQRDLASIQTAVGYVSERPR